MTDLRDQCILVTGGSGFLGRHVLRELRRREASAVYHPSSACDLRTIEGAEAAFAHRPQVVIHLAAACGGIAANRAEPGRYLHDNALMALHVVEACRRHGVGKLITVGSCCSYPKHCPVPFSEESLWDGYPEETNAPYGIAKRLLLELGRAYRQQYGLNVVQLIPANLYGPGDHFEPQTSHVIPGLIRKCAEAAASGADSITLWGTGTPTRDFLYVEDAAEAIVLAAERLHWCEPMNVGTGIEVSIHDLANRVAWATGFGGRVAFDPSMPDGQPRRCLDVSRALEALGWTARTSLEEGLRRTVRWYREHAARPAARR